MSEIASFRAKLAPIIGLLDDASVEEIAINRPHELWLAKRGRHMERLVVPEMDFARLRSLAEVTAAYTSQETSSERPLLSAKIPINLADGIANSERGGYRVQIVLPPVVEEGTIGLCIRKPTLLDLDLDAYEAQGAFEWVNQPLSASQDTEAQLRALYAEGRWKEFLRLAVRSRKNIVVSAGTNTGKTTFLNGLAKDIGEFERCVTIEDARELSLRQANCLHMTYSRGGQGIAKVTPVDLMETVLRLTPDRAIIGELRGAEAYAYLELLNTGHSGSLTSIHADSPELMFDRLAQMVMRFGTPLDKPQIIAFAKTLIHVVVQLKHDKQTGRRFISEIRYAGA